MRLLGVAIVVTVVGDAENAGEGLAGVGLFGAGDELGRALGDDAAAAFAAFGAEVNDPIGLLDDVEVVLDDEQDRKSTRLNSSHGYISYAVFCLKKKIHNEIILSNYSSYVSGRIAVH